jgi:enamine deaminase RidA (YjgF/YER057c/UK114 family)
VSLNKQTVAKKAMHAPRFLNEPIEYHKSFSRGIRVDIGNSPFIFISGTASIDEKGNTFCPGDFMAQTKRTFANLTALLNSEKATWHDVVQTRCYLKDMRDYAKFNEYRNWFYKKQKLNPFPASVCVEAGLCRPELLVEIEAMAILKKIE